MVTCSTGSTNACNNIWNAYATEYSAEKERHNNKLLKVFVAFLQGWIDCCFLYTVVMSSCCSECHPTT